MAYQRKKPIGRKKSLKRSAPKDDYSQQAKVYLEKEENKYCHACQQVSEQAPALSCEVHHTYGRGRYKMDQSTWMAVCRDCHEIIEKHRRLAFLLGFSFSPLTLQDDIYLKDLFLGMKDRLKATGYEREVVYKTLQLSLEGFELALKDII